MKVLRTLLGQVLFFHTDYSLVLCSARKSIPKKQTLRLHYVTLRVTDNCHQLIIVFENRAIVDIINYCNI